jgi:peptidoglycan hydrolase-like protein with peptidoglycan-binding domain
MTSVAAHAEARSLSNKAFVAVYGHAPSLGERQFLQAIGCVETSYGKGWRGDGIGSNNIGAIQAPGGPPCNPATSFETTDTHEDGSTYSWCYKRYATLLDGWIDLVRTLYARREGVRRLANDNDFSGAVAQMRATRYFEAPLDVYRRRVDSCLVELTAALGEPYSPKVVVGESSASPSLVPPVPPTITRGAKGEVVRRWQKLIGVFPDGRFGSVTELATVRWQADRSLKPDGIVGPKTWGKALQ